MGENHSRGIQSNGTAPVEMANGMTFLASGRCYFSVGVGEVDCRNKAMIRGKSEAMDPAESTGAVLVWCCQYGENEEMPGEVPSARGSTKGVMSVAEANCKIYEGSLAVLSIRPVLCG